jgi:membrane protein implicated in regulation of membrane protease activity
MSSSWPSNFSTGLVSLVLMILAIFGMEHDDAVDAISSGSVDHDAGGIFSVKPLTGFFLGFGWIGGFSVERGAPIWLAVVLGCLAGAAMMAVIVFMFRAILAMRSDGTARIQDAVGAVGTVYISLPATKGGGGQVTVNFRGRQETYSALQAGEKPISSGEKVKVVSLIDSRTLFVEPL